MVASGGGYGKQIEQRPAVRQPRLRLVRLERQPYPPGDSGRLSLERDERLTTIGAWQADLLRPQLEELGKRAVEQQRGRVGIRREFPRRGDEAGDDARALTQRLPLVTSLEVSDAMCGQCGDARRAPQDVARMLARSGWMRHGMVHLSVGKKQLSDLARRY